MKSNHSPRVRPLFVLFDILINVLLIAVGVLIYYHFTVRMFAPVDLHPLLISLIGSKPMTVLIVSGLPLFIGVLGMITTIIRLMKRIFARGQH